MVLEDVLPGAPPAARGIEVTGLAYDNRRVEPGAVFFCVPGFTRDGHDFAAHAVERGAAALVVERPLAVDAPQIVVPDVREAMALAAARFYGDPSAELQVVGVTGTNGKTTTAFLVRELLEAQGVRCGLLGTVKSVIGGGDREVVRTTPEAVDLQHDLRAMVDAGDAACAMEVSSHALELGRVTGVRFAAAVFTNLTQDHLDFHPTMEAYFQAKRRLFGMAPAAAVVNVDDPYGARLAAELRDPITFSLGGEATYSAVDVRTGLRGSEFTLRTPEGRVAVRTPLRGRYNVANVLAALGAARALGVELATAVAALAHAGHVPGRLEPVGEGQAFEVLVDYAHTPDSLENVLAAARELGEGRVHVVFGCGGDRDRGKRPLMGEIAVRLADRAIVTSDNPRSEDPEQIIREILAGARGDVCWFVDRRAAIAEAIAGAEAGDVVVIAGKGHEQGQEFAAGRKLPFDDVAVARDVLRAQALSRT